MLTRGDHVLVTDAVGVDGVQLFLSKQVKHGYASSLSIRATMPRLVRMLWIIIRPFCVQ